MSTEALSKYYENGFPKDKIIRDLNLFVAHLSSAAIRLSTINEKNNMEFTNSYEDEWRANIKTEDLADQFFKKREKYVHLFLRDNVGHIERADSKNIKKKTIWGARQIALEKMTLIMIFDLMKNVIDDYRGRLNKKFHNRF